MYWIFLGILLGRLSFSPFWSSSVCIQGGGFLHLVSLVITPDSFFNYSNEQMFLSTIALLSFSSLLRVLYLYCDFSVKGCKVNALSQLIIFTWKPKNWFLSKGKLAVILGRIIIWWWEELRRKYWKGFLKEGTGARMKLPLHWECCWKPMERQFVLMRVEPKFLSEWLIMSTHEWQL